MAASGLAPRVAQALASLPAAQRDVLLLHAWGGLSQRGDRGRPGVAGSHRAVTTVARPRRPPLTVAGARLGPRPPSRCVPGQPHVVLKQKMTSREEMNMVDEIELVRQFRSDVPEPSPQARAQAWAAVMAVATDEGDARARAVASPAEAAVLGEQVVRWWHWRRPSLPSPPC